MSCENCDKRLIQGACDKCLRYENLANYSKHISNAFYNKGLIKAQNRDISGAIKDLEKSISYDSDNYYARNLIGLCYHELGMFGEASKNWFMSAYNDFEDNDVQRYIAEIGEELSKNKDFVRSIELYNMALEKLNDKEIAAAYTLLIEATHKNEKLIPALNLLVFVHLVQGQKESAIPIIDKVLAIDAKNEQALYYYTLATKNKYRANNNMQTQSMPVQNAQSKFPTQTPVVEEMTRIVDTKSIIVSVIVSVIVTAALTYFVTSSMGGSKAEYEELNTKYQETLTASKTAADEFAKTSAEKDTQIATLTAENEELTSQLQSYKNVENLKEAKKYYDSKDYEEAATRLYQVDKNTLSEENLKVYSAMAKTTFTKSIQSLYDSGRKKFDEGNYVDSKSDLQNAYLYCDKVEVDDSVIANIIYYLARDFEALGDNQQAIEYYNLLLDKYPNHAEDAEERIASIS